MRRVEQAPSHYEVELRQPAPGDGRGEAAWRAVRRVGPDGTMQPLRFATLQAATPSRFQRLYVAVDVTHAAAMFWLAAVDERRRRPALVSGTAALASAALTLAARRSRATRAARQNDGPGDATRPAVDGSRPRRPADGTGALP